MMSTARKSAGGKEEEEMGFSAKCCGASAGISNTAHLERSSMGHVDGVVSVTSWRERESERGRRPGAAVHAVHRRDDDSVLFPSYRCATDKTKKQKQKPKKQKPS